MKFNFKIQPYQTDAVNAVVRVFTGQKFQQNHTYRREVNAKASEQAQTSFMADEFGETLDAASDIGYNNALIKLTDDQLLQNIQRLQQENNIHEDTALVKKLGRSRFYLTQLHGMKFGYFRKINGYITYLPQ